MTYVLDGIPQTVIEFVYDLPGTYRIPTDGQCHLAGRLAGHGRRRGPQPG